MPHTDTLLTAVFSDGARVQATEDHVFFNASTGTWSEIRYVTPGDQLHTQNRARNWSHGARHTTHPRQAPTMCSARYGPRVQLQLGQRGFDVTSRTLTLLSVDGSELAATAFGDPAAQPDIVELTGIDAATAQAHIADLATRFTGVIAVRTSDANLAAGCLKHGAEVVHDPAGFRDPNYLHAVEEAGAAVIVSCPGDVTAPIAFLHERIRWARGVGVASNQIMVTATSDQIALLSSEAVVMFDGGRGTDAQGAHAVGVMQGARVIARTAVDNDMQATKRTIDTVSELIERREPERCDPETREPVGAI